MLSDAVAETVTEDPATVAPLIGAVREIAGGWESDGIEPTGMLIWTWTSLAVRVRL
jgi:hypothetical protein